MKIAVINPSFTNAAYGHGDRFYAFYEKYQVWGVTANYSMPVTSPSDLAMLTAPVSTWVDPAVKTLANHLRTIFPSTTTINILTDMDVHNGALAAGRYDITCIFHEEYVTQQEYSNFKSYVANGGVLVVMTGNVFYAEVAYNKSNSVSLVRGHGWRYDGRQATRLGTYNQRIERWNDETRDWMGSNFDQVIFGQKSDGNKIYRFLMFKNNPFGYSQVEEQEITNPADEIILNYGATLSSANLQVGLKNPVVATYYKDYGRGRVLVFGLWTNNLLSNGKFVSFFDNVFFTYAVRRGRLPSPPPPAAHPSETVQPLPSAMMRIPPSMTAKVPVIDTQLGGTSQGPAIPAHMPGIIPSLVPASAVPSEMMKQTQDYSKLVLPIALALGVGILLWKILKH